MKKILIWMRAALFCLLWLSGASSWAIDISPADGTFIKGDSISFDVSETGRGCSNYGDIGNISFRHTPSGSSASAWRTVTFSLTCNDYTRGGGAVVGGWITVGGWTDGKVEIQANLGRGWSAIQTVTIDSISPYISGTYAAWKGANLHFSGSVSDTGGIKSVEIKYAGADLWWTGSAGAYANDILYSALPEAVKTQLNNGESVKYSVVATDKAGNVSTVDGTIPAIQAKPILRWSNLADHDLYNPNQAFVQEYTVTGAEIKELALLIDEETPTYRREQILGDVAEGAHSVDLHPWMKDSTYTYSVNLRGKDVFGRDIEVEQKRLTLQIDSAAPVLSGFTSKWDGANLHLEGTMTDQVIHLKDSAFGYVKHVEIKSGATTLKTFLFPEKTHSGPFVIDIPFSTFPDALTAQLRAGTAASISVIATDVVNNATPLAEADQVLPLLPAIPIFHWKNFSDQSIYKPGKALVLTYIVDGAVAQLPNKKYRLGLYIDNVWKADLEGDEKEHTINVEQYLDRTLAQQEVRVWWIDEFARGPVDGGWWNEARTVLTDNQPPDIEDFKAIWSADGKLTISGNVVDALSNVTEMTIRDDERILVTRPFNGDKKSEPFSAVISFSEFSEHFKTQLRKKDEWMNLIFSTKDVLGNVPAGKIDRSTGALPIAPTVTWDSLTTDTTYKPGEKWIENYTISGTTKIVKLALYERDSGVPFHLNLHVDVGNYSIDLSPDLTFNTTHSLAFQITDIFGRTEWGSQTIRLQADSEAPMLSDFKSVWDGGILNLTGTVKDDLSGLKEIQIKSGDTLLKTVTFSGTEKSKKFLESIPFSSLPVGIQTVLRMGSGGFQLSLFSADILGNVTDIAGASQRISPLPRAPTLLWKNLPANATFKPGVSWPQTYVIAGGDLLGVHLDINGKTLQTALDSTVGEHVFEFTQDILPGASSVIGISGKDIFGRSVWPGEVTVQADNTAPTVEEFRSVWDGDNLKINGSVIDLLSDVATLQYTGKLGLTTIPLDGSGKQRTFVMQIPVDDLVETDALTLTAADVLGNVLAYTLRLNPFSASALKLGVVLDNQQAITDAGGAYPQDALMYKLTVKSNQSAVQGVNVTFKLPPQLIASGQAQVTDAQGNVSPSTWDGDAHPLLIDGVTLAKGESMIIVVPTTIKDAAGLHDQYFVQTTFVAHASNITGSVSAQHMQAIERGAVVWTPLQLLKQPENAEILPGKSLLYTITFKNRGTKPINNVMVSDMVKKETHFMDMWCGKDSKSNMGSVSAHLNCTAHKPDPNSLEPGKIRWEITGTLQPNESGTVSYQVELSR